MTNAGIVTATAGGSGCHPGRRRYDLDDPADVAVLYERIIVESTSLADLDLLATPTVRAVWPRLFLPATVRELWQARLPELSRAA